MLIPLGIDELHVDTHGLTGAQHASFQEVTGVQLLADLSQVLGTLTILHHRRATPHAQPADLGELGEDLVVDAVGEVLVLLKPAPISKR